MTNLKSIRFINFLVHCGFRTTFLALAFCNSVLAQEGFTGDGFGGRSWYKPANVESGWQGSGAGIIRGQLYLWGTFTSTAIISPVPGVSGTSPSSIPFQGAVDYTGQVEANGLTTGYGNGGGGYANPYPVPGFSSVKLISLTQVNGLIKTDGTGWVWGGINSWIFGTAHSTPVQVVSNAKHVSASWTHVAFVLNDGTVWSVGDNTWGNYGNGTTVPQYNSSNSFTNMVTTAVKMNGITNAVRVAVIGNSQTANAGGGDHNGTIVLKADGTVWVAGAGGVLVSNSTNSTPTQVPGLSNVVDVKAAQSVGIALTQAGDVYVWGNVNGTVGGIGTNTLFGGGSSAGLVNYTPVKVSFPPGTPPMVAIESDPVGAAIFTLDENHVLWAWGTNTLLGAATQTTSNLPIISAKNILDVNTSFQGATYIVRTTDYPAKERLWFTVPSSSNRSSSIMGLNPEYFAVAGVIRNGTNWILDYRVGSGNAETWYPSCPSCFGLDELGTVTPTTSISGTVNCAATAIVGSLVVGTASSVLLKVTATVSTTGSSSFTVSGSGLSAAPSPYTFSATATGQQSFYLPMDYDGSALGNATFTFSGLGACTADLSGLTPRPAITPITPLVNCTPITPVVLSK